MTVQNKALTNHEVTICLQGGAVLGPFKATWSTELTSDIRELVKDYDTFLQTGKQTRFKYHLHDSEKRFAHTLVLHFSNLTGLYDRVALSDD